MSRRTFLKSSVAGVAGTSAIGTGLITSAPAIAQNRTELNIVSTWPRDFPELGPRRLMTVFKRISGKWDRI